MNPTDRPTSKPEMIDEQPQMRGSWWLVLAAAALLSLSWASPASADAKVMVQVRSASGASVEGTVLLTSAGGDKFRCQTAGGRCQISAVPGGRYVVLFQPKKGEPTAPRKVMIPPSGDVKLTVAAK